MAKLIDMWFGFCLQRMDKDKAQAVQRPGRLDGSEE